MSVPKAVIFDFDGVIVESLAVKTRAFGELFAADHPEIVEQVVRLHVENPGVSRYDKFRTIYRDMLGRPLDDAEMARLDERFSDLVFSGVVACDFVAGAEGLLARLAPSVRLHVASATPQEELRRIVAARGLSEHFTDVRGSPATKSDIVAEVLAAATLEPREALFVGDAITDHRAAASHGVPFVGRVPEGEPSPFEDLDVPIVRDMAELGRRWEDIASPVG